MPLEAREIKLFSRDIPGFCSDIPAAPEKFEKKSLCSALVPYLGDCPGLGGCQKCIYVFFGVIPYGEESTQIKYPQNFGRT